ncbi:hypothetical protein BHAOGJBA_4287 [Methylobacterium hispanicum]|uniref:Uncharacterized protein n=1 Tax=Methylobacterium hispanicum TaxID=270350 RepID=A0AAV4ZRY7_9HYPH|nr:hypothetical protein [Methylobacterium hispanicum]GJD90745.1 hypothetical protein BHAOGJBA_4287 [Methylobacterium hispanicum]
MISERRATRTTTPGSSVLAVGVFSSRDRRHLMPFIALSALLTTTPPAASAIDPHRFESTALTTRPTLPAFRECALIKRIRELATYQVGWDGPESVGPTIETVKQAIDFARQLQALGDVAQPYVSLANDGEINFYWKTPRLALDLGFTGTGRYSYYGETPDGAEFAEDGAEIGQPLPPDLIAVLRA